jgi:hypothetical protein
MVAALDHLADYGDAGRAQQLTELGKLLLSPVGDDCDQEGTLACAAPVQPGGPGLTVRLPVSLH